MDAKELDEIEKLAEAATKGPWGVDPGEKIDELYINDEPTDGRVARIWNGRTKCDQNAAFIAAARAAVPLLIAAVRDLQAQAAEVPDIIGMLEQQVRERDAEIAKLRSESAAVAQFDTDVAALEAELAKEKDDYRKASEQRNDYAARLDVAGKAWQRMLEADLKGMGNPVAKVEAMREIQDILNGRGSVRSNVVSELSALRTRLEAIAATWGRLRRADGTDGDIIAKVEAMREINDLVNGRGIIRTALKDGAEKPRTRRCPGFCSTCDVLYGIRKCKGTGRVQGKAKKRKVRK